MAQIESFCCVHWHRKFNAD